MTEIRNPVNFLSLLPLLPAEKDFVRCLAEGEFCIIGGGELPKEGIESGDGANVVRGEVIRFFAYGGNEENPVSGPTIYLQGAWISVVLDLPHSNIPYALMFNNCHFDAFVSMQYAECVALYLNGSRLVQGLYADGLTTRGDVNFRDGFSAEDEVRLLSASIGGNLDCADGKFHNPGKYAISADGLTAKGHVYLRRDFSAEGGVRLLGANIGGSLDCEGGKFHNPDGNALHADGLTTKDLVCLGGGFSAEGGVQLLGANIGGNLDCEGGKFHNPGKYALSADGLTTKGSVNFRDGFSVEGEVRLLSASISENLDCTGGKFHNPKGYALNVDGGNISGGLLWWNTTCEGDVNLAYAKADVLADAPDSWKSCKVALDGFIYNRFVGPVDFHSCIEWLAKRPDGMEFSPQPYEQAAKVLFGMGHVQGAREILLEKERLQTKDGKMHWLRKVGRRLWDVFAGYGYRLRYTAAWMMGIVVFGTVIFGVADSHGNIVPTHPVVALSKDYREKIAPDGDFLPTQAVKPEYPAFNPLLFSLDVFTPSAVFHQEDSWGPRSGGGEWTDLDVDILWFLTLWYWLEVAMGWILTSMLLLSVTGLLRPRQSSSEKD